MLRKFVKFGLRVVIVLLVVAVFLMQSAYINPLTPSYLDITSAPSDLFYHFPLGGIRS